MTKPPKLIIVGGGSAAFAAAIRADDLGVATTLINDGLPLGGTCVNVGCVPSKTLIRAAESVHRADSNQFRGIELRGRLVDFMTVTAQKNDLVAELRQTKYLNIATGLPNLEILEGHARLKGPTMVEVDGRIIEADRVLLATGSSPAVPPIPGLTASGYLTSQSAFELEKLPESLIILGGRYIALECAQMFARFGSRVTILQRSPRILPTETPDLTDPLTEYLRQEGIEIVTEVLIKEVKHEGKSVAIETETAGRMSTYKADQLLVAAGRSPNSSGFGLAESGIRLDARGNIMVDDMLQTSLKGVYAAGDVIGWPQFVYTAAYEGSLAVENALMGSSKKRDYSALPWVIFTDPQLAGVGLDEKQAREQGLEPDSRILPLDQVPRAQAARDTRGLIILVRDYKSDKIIGARILAPEGGELLMELSLAIKYGLTARQLAETFHPYLTLSEGVKLAALSFHKDTSKLSCCAN